MSMNPFNQVIVLTTAEVNKLCSQATRGCSVKRNTTTPLDLKRLPDSLDVDRASTEFQRTLPLIMFLKIIGTYLQTIQTLPLTTC